jgi:hypothetical protein
MLCGAKVVLGMKMHFCVYIFNWIWLCWGFWCVVTNVSKGSLSPWVDVPQRQNIFRHFLMCEVFVGSDLGLETWTLCREIRYRLYPRCRAWDMFCWRILRWSWDSRTWIYIRDAAGAIQFNVGRLVIVKLWGWNYVWDVTCDSCFVSRFVTFLCSGLTGPLFLHQRSFTL